MISFFKKIFLKDKKKSEPIKDLKWYKNSLKVYIAPIKFLNDTAKITLYQNMVITACTEWANATNGNLSFEFVDKLHKSDINIEWYRLLEKNSLSNCTFTYNKQGILYGAEIQISLLNKINNSDVEVYHTILHSVGVSLGVPQTNNIEDIMCKPHKYGIIELSENDKNVIYNLYREFDPGIQAFIEKIQKEDFWDFVHYFKKWNGYDVFIVGMDGSKGDLGDEQVILLRNGEKRYAIHEERDEILNL